MNDKKGFDFSKLMQHTDLIVALGVLGILVVMILPIPAFLMDLFIVTNITVAIAILLVSVYAGKPLDFSVFPTVLLFATLFRLALNIASIRLILVHGHEGTAAAGHIIETFGEFVVGGSYIVGAVVFILLVVINFVVITKGSGRVAEVAARFILDSMPGKQMSIDADLNAGLINEEQARERRRKVEQEADFYGAMDGASKFVRGDAIAGILITLINVIGGFAIGVFQKGLALDKAAQLYTLMTIGDGLVTQIPSLIISTASGIIVTRAASGSNLSKEVAKQILMQPRAMSITSGILFLLGLIPGLPAGPFFLLAIVLATASWAVRNHEKVQKEKKEKETKKAAEVQAIETNVPPEVDILELQVGYGLVNIVEGENKSDLIDRIFGIRKEFAKDLGIIVPKVRIKDNLELQPNEYSLLIKGISVGSGELMPGYVLAMDPGDIKEPIGGIETKEPVFGLPAIWIPLSQKEKAQMLGYTVVDGSTVIATHLSEIIRTHSSELIGRQELQGLIDNLAKTHPKVVEELIPTILPLGTVLKVCQGLLREQVPIRDMLTVMETLANYGPSYKDPEVLIEFVRTALARTITHRLLSNSGELEVMHLQPKTEEMLIRAYQKAEGGGNLNLEAGFFERLVSSIQKEIEDTVFSNGYPVLLCHPLVRSSFKKMVSRFIPNLTIISANEISNSAKVKFVATVEA
ncbi:MAG: flagellar biosynthesis protein FlhA [Proteobacteria bacterium]|nr:flagellar biosynthesis protein FlhA [Pseudomonadota bacterium]NBY19554.1 flagellar biosynthesis protein FlhA [bacterium]